MNGRAPFRTGSVPDNGGATTVKPRSVPVYQGLCSVILFPLPLYIYTEQKKTRPMHLSMHFSKSTLFSDTARYVYYGADIRLPDVLIRFFISTNCCRVAQLD